jgi:hypothetical protein
MPHAFTSDHHGHYGRPVIAAGVLVDLRTAAKLGCREDESLVGQAVVSEVGDERAKRAVHAR